MSAVYEEDFRTLMDEIRGVEDRLGSRMDETVKPLQSSLNRIHEGLDGPKGMFVRLDRLEQRGRLIGVGFIAGIPLAWDYVKRQIGWH